MGRTLMYTTLGVLFLLVLSSFFVLEHGGERIPKPGTGSADNSTPSSEVVSLHDLTSVPGLTEYQDHSVTTRGTLFFNSEINEHVIIDGDQNFQVVIHSPDKIADFEGKRVVVTGTFHQFPGNGPTIEATSVQLDGEGS